MGDHKVKIATDTAELRKFSQKVFRDIEALEKMMEDGLIESGITRIGAEQELCLIDSGFAPSNEAGKILELMGNPQFTTELAKYNLEINLLPREFDKFSLAEMEKELKSHLDSLDNAIARTSSRYIFTGILPTIRKSDLTLDNMTDNPRYHELNQMMTEMRGGSFDIRIQGSDELITSHDSVMVESCTTSFQVHYQVQPDDFVASYNWAQAIAAPVLGLVTNSPLFLGKRLWRESRIAIFRQSVDTRANSEHLRVQPTRVRFGEDWVHNSIVDIFKANAVEYRVIVSKEIEADPMVMLENGQIPKLQALNLHNSTIYPWNRACYGTTDGKPHFRIECRYIPSGPSIIDEMANTAFWLGLMHGRPEQYDNIHELIDFQEVRTNFIRAAKTGLGGLIRWIGGKELTARELILGELLPISRQGLEKAGIPDEEIDKHLGVIAERINTGRTGSQWILDGFNGIRKTENDYLAAVAVVAGMNSRQLSGKPVHEWDIATADEAGNWKDILRRVDQIMQKALYTANVDDPVALIPRLMGWKKIRHVPIENNSGELVGLVTPGTLLKFYGNETKDDSIPVSEIMIPNPVCVTLDADIKEVLKIMIGNQISAVPVVNENGKLVGIITERDIVRISRHWLEE